jgi:hypothetical protein
MEEAAFLKKTKCAYQEGYKFHQSLVKENRIVQEWVLRQNYWDYKLPAD